ncbi:hypothetical protein [Bradyrhizobium sp. WD16]|uniref:hypothetical protein n=1 Tax=Bradyrhizobium sp. WD16 TaxID=1521768 RepID=UPI0020A5E6D4|nr:hypothetical protein [Bradyrhizobium sp. WD16]UTD27679.1 hypothetical protein DB459_12915 [Bradyrhizobium sp. WD16]
MTPSIYRTFYPNEPAEFDSDLSVEVSIARLQARVPRAKVLTPRFGISGSVARDDVEIRYLSFFSGTRSPVFNGIFEERDGKAVLRGSYSTTEGAMVGTTLALAFLAIWTFVAIAHVLGTVFHDLRSIIANPAELLIPLGGFGFIGCFYLLARFQWWYAQCEISSIERTIRSALSAPK